MYCDLEELIRLDGQKRRKRLVISGRKDPEALAAVLKARDRGWVKPTAYGGSLTELAGEVDVSRISADIQEGRMEALGLVQKGEADVFMDMGPLDARFFALLKERATAKEEGKVLSYVSIMIEPKKRRPTLLTDTLINQSPGLEEKVGIVENAVHVARALEMQKPRIAALAPLELVNPALPSTLDAAVLSKMSERGQFGKAIVEGPLAMDNAESASAAQRKGITSPVPGNVDIYLFPDLESANLTAQFFSWLGRFQLAGVLAGTSIPVVIRSPLERPEAWLANLSLGLLL